ncbi:MAG: hypothetical protein LQ343_005417 [Gyalolechia ehrenbergii]|nr:MAG: hypothetical protein LQ343_005417 [Gyalolechia ehrenbergii]
MPYSHHSHSGQFCAHAQDTLEGVVKTAIEKNMQVFALTEHMPREKQDMYPEEIAAGYSEEKLFDIFSDYYIEALRLQRKYASELNILIGTEIDWIRPSSKNFIENLFTTFQLQLFVGSVHHVHGIPIDFTAELFQEARQTSGGSDEGLFEDYFDLQHDMLEALKPPIVGHFDLIRLKSDDPDLSFVEMQGVWRKIRRNLAFIASYGGTLELNSAALRKGLEEPYPNAEISKEFLALGGQFTLSDDSHGIDHVGSYYRDLLRFAGKVGITQITFFEKGSATQDCQLPEVTAKTTPLSQLQSHPFFASCRAT